MNIPLLLFLLAGGVAFYILIGYPLLLRLVRFPAAPPVKTDPGHLPSVSVIVAVYNGAAFLRAKIESLLELDYPANRLEIFIVSDGSTDDTGNIAGEYAGRGVHSVAVPRGGKAQALNAGLRLASGEILFFTDVRQPLDRQALRKLTANFADPSVGAVTGELRLLQGDRGEQADMSLYWRYEVWVRKLHSAMYSILGATGCIYAIRRSLVRPLPPDTLSDDVCLPLQAFFAGRRIVMEPQAVAFDYPAVPGTEYRRRVRTLAGLLQAFIRHPALFSPSTPMWLHFLSHKFGRLVLPWAFLAMFVSTLLLPPSPLQAILLAGQLALPALALADRFVLKEKRLKRLSSLAKTFLLMNAAAVAALSVFFVPAAKLWGTTRVVRN